MDTISEYLCHEWVDEVFVKISETEPYPQKLIDEIIIMGLTVHLSLGEMEKSLSGKNFIEKIGGYSVITSSINTASPKQLLYKRLMDIAGGIVGCLLTVILIVVIGPMIYIKSPGPIFFSQVRIGKNGKKFKIYSCDFFYTRIVINERNPIDGKILDRSAQDFFNRLFCFGEAYHNDHGLFFLFGRILFQDIFFVPYPADVVKA